VIWENRRRAVMRLAIQEAGMCIPEDPRPHPMVGALLVDRHWNVVLRAHRNETCSGLNVCGRGGDHAERILLQKASALGISVSDKILVVTLEPCSRRGNRDKIPCAQRVVASGIREVWFGALDPDPGQLGKGEEILRFNDVRVERFPDDLVQAIRLQSWAFISQFAALYRAV
jgi:pyrimidine deaminase RibD-like protein